MWFSIFKLDPWSRSKTRPGLHSSVHCPRGLTSLWSISSWVTLKLLPSLAVFTTQTDKLTHNNNDDNNNVLAQHHIQPLLLHNNKQVIVQLGVGRLFHRGTAKTNTDLPGEHNGRMMQWESAASGISNSAGKTHQPPDERRTSEETQTLMSGLRPQEKT